MLLQYAMKRFVKCKPGYYRARCAALIMLTKTKGAT